MAKPAPGRWSQAAMEVLSVVACEQPITRAEISNIRATDSGGVIETLLARRLIEDDPRFGSRGRPSFLATTADFSARAGLASLAYLPPRPVPSRSAATDRHLRPRLVAALVGRTPT
jgi:segregation and condensation protein B